MSAFELAVNDSKLNKNYVKYVPWSIWSTRVMIESNRAVPRGGAASRRNGRSNGGRLLHDIPRIPFQSLLHLLPRSNQSLPPSPLHRSSSPVHSPLLSLGFTLFTSSRCRGRASLPTGTSGFDIEVDDTNDKHFFLLPFSNPTLILQFTRYD